MIKKLEKAFCRHPITKFSIVVFDNQIKKSEFGHRVVLPFSKSKRLYGPFGFSLHHVVELDWTKEYVNPLVADWAKQVKNEVPTGGLIEVVIEGEFIEYFNKDLQLPYRQPVYIDPETDEVTWKKLGPEVGYIINHNDNGWADVYFNGDK